VLIVKSDGGLNELGFSTFVTEITTEAFAAIADGGRVISTEDEVFNPQVILEFTTGELIEHSEVTSGLIYVGNCIRMTDEASKAGYCVMVKV
jgi:hypothetical protein